MRRIYITTLKRGVPGSGEDTGLLYCLDWDSGEVIHTIPVVTGPDAHAPGRSHGCRGVTVHEGKLYVAWYDHNLSVFDLDTLQRLYDLSFPEIKCTHQVKSHGGFLWVVSTGNNSVVQIKNDKVENIINLEEVDAQVSPFFKANHLRTRDWHTEDKLHFNSIGWTPQGDMVHTYYEADMIFNWSRKEIVHQGFPLEHPHDVLFLDGDRYLVSNSGENHTVLFRADGTFTQFNYQEGPESVAENAAWIGHTRGLAASQGGEFFFACSAPGNVCLFNSDTLELLGSKSITSVEHETIYDLVLDPRDWI